MLMYADETINQNANEIVINAELEKVNKWLCSNKLSLYKQKKHGFSSQSKTSTISKYKNKQY